MILTSQIFSFANFTNEEDRVRRSCAELVARAWFETERRAPVYFIECNPLLAGCDRQLKEWKVKLESGAATVRDYQAWQRKPGIDEEEITCFPNLYGSMDGTGALEIQCYPAELMTEGEVARRVGIFCGSIEPRISEPRNSERKLPQLIETQRRKGDKIILLARGGRYARTSYAYVDGSSGKTAFRNGLGQVNVLDSDQSVQLINDQHLAQHLASLGTVLAASAIGTQLDSIGANLILLPYLGFNYSSIPSRVDLVIHHGGAGTTIAALKAGVP